MRGKVFCNISGYISVWDHPRMCGEKALLWRRCLLLVGSPPHVRGKVICKAFHHPYFGITPACAGKRFFSGLISWVPWDHPRMCGEKHVDRIATAPQIGSPPHVRGKGNVSSVDCVGQGITPACAGKSPAGAPVTLPAEDHPRMCGEKMCTASPHTLRMGSPPHVRGKAKYSKLMLIPHRITPACAGKRLKRSRSTVPPVAIVPLFPSVCNKPVVSDGSPAGRDAPLFLPAENAVPASPAYNLRSL